LLTFPALSSVLLPQLEKAAGVFANGTSTVALVPASISSAWGFRREMYELRRLLIWLIPPSILGGGAGAWLLVQFPDQFNALVPWLILLAAALFTLQPYVMRWLTRSAGRAQDIRESERAIPPRSLAGMIALQFLISVYGGYFGAGIGILMLSGLGLMGLTDMHQMNGIKAVLGTAINAVAAVLFVATAKVYWPFALAMMATSVAGGYLAAHYSRQIKSQYIRWV